MNSDISVLLSGAVAGFTEHSVMYPIDTVKTRLQVSGNKGMPIYNGVLETIRSVRVREGSMMLYRGLPTVLLASVPSHAAYFSVLEYSRKLLGSEDSSVTHALSGAFATVAHDSIVTPLDVIKQRMQVYGSVYKNSFASARHVVMKYGIRTLYASLPTTLLMNVPFMALFVSSYEACKLELEFLSGTPKYLVSASIAGAIAGGLTTPLDVLKTHIQVQGVRGSMFKAPFRIASEIYSNHGYKGFVRGAGARAVYFMPSAAICWTTYELMKNIFNVDAGHDIDDLLPI